MTRRFEVGPILVLVAVWEWMSLGLRAGRPPVGH